MNHIEFKVEREKINKILNALIKHNTRNLMLKIFGSITILIQLIIHERSHNFSNDMCFLKEKQLMQIMEQKI